MLRRERWSLEAMAGLGSTTYHDLPSLSGALGLSLTRALDGGTDLILRGRGYRLANVGILEAGMGLRFSPLER